MKDLFSISSAAAAVDGGFCYLFLFNTRRNGFQARGGTCGAAKAEAKAESKAKAETTTAKGEAKGDAKR